MGKASLPKTSINDTLDANKERKKQFGRERAAFTNISGVAATAGSGVNATTNNVVQVTTLPTGGGTMMGPIAFYPKLQFLNTGSTTLDISKATDTSYSSRVIVSGQSNAATISTISGAAHAGQILFLQAASAQTITINETGNISIPGSTTSYVMTANEIILLQYDSTTTKWITITLGGGSSGAGLTDNNVWTGTNQFTGSYVTVTGSFSATGASITLGDASTDIINFGGKAGTDLNMGTYDITNLDNISFGAGTQNIADTTTPVNNLFVKQVRLQSGSLTTNKPNITSSSSGGNTVDLNFTTGSGFIIYEQGQPKHTFSGSSLTTPNILSSGTWTLTSDTNSPNTNGMFARVGGHVKVYTGGALKSLSDIGTGSGGASLSGNNTWTGTNSFNGTYVTVAGTFSATGAAFTIGNASSDQLYINSTMQSDLDMGDNDLTDVQSVRFGAVSLSPLNGTLWYDGSNLKGKSSSGGTFTIDGSGSGSGVGLGDNNTWTGTNTFNGSYVTVTGTFSATGAAISLGNHSSDTVNIGGTLGGNLRMGDNDIDDIDNLNVDGTANLNSIVNLGNSSNDDINLKGKLDVINNTTASTGPFSNIYYTGYIEIKVGSSTKRLYYGNG